MQRPFGCIERTARSSAVTHPLRRYLHLALKSFRSKCKVDRSPEFVRDEIANDLHSIPGCVGIPDAGAAGFLPFDANWSARVTAQSAAPTDGDASITHGQRAVLCGIGRQLVQYHGQGLTGFRTQRYFRTIDICVGAGGVGRQFAVNEL